MRTKIWDFLGGEEDMRNFEIGCGDVRGEARILLYLFTVLLF
jgi:hypothetical protein